MSEIDREIDKNTNPLYKGLKEDLQEFGERFGLKTPDLEQFIDPEKRQVAESLADCERLWLEGKEKECFMIMKKLCKGS